MAHGAGGGGAGCCEGRVEAQGVFVAGPGEAGLGPLVENKGCTRKTAFTSFRVFWKHCT